MDLIPPYWFAMRQGKAEPAGEHVLRLTAPNMEEAFIAIRRADDGQWSGALRKTADGPDTATTGGTYPTEREAWEAAFELYRVQLII